MKRAVILLAACGQKPAVVENSAAAEPLVTELVRDVGAGGSVAIVGGNAGVRAVSSDGNRARVLVSDGPAPWVVVDPRANVVWFGSPDRTVIRALDLDAHAPAPIAVASNVPAPEHQEMVGPALYGVAYPSDDPTVSAGEAMMTGEHYSTGESLAQTHVDLVIGAQPAVEGAAGYPGDAAWDRSFTQVHVDAAAFLAKVRARHHAASHDAATETRVDGVDPAACENEGECGAALTIPGTHFVRVVVGTSTGDIHHIEYALYDTDAKALVAAGWTSWLHDAWLAPDHTAFVWEGIVVRFDGGPVAETPVDGGAAGGGWLGGGLVYY